MRPVLCLVSPASQHVDLALGVDSFPRPLLITRSFFFPCHPDGTPFSAFFRPPSLTHSPFFPLWMNPFGDVAAPCPLFLLGRCLCEPSLARKDFCQSNIYDAPHCAIVGSRPGSRLRRSCARNAFFLSPSYRRDAVRECLWLTSPPRLFFFFPQPPPPPSAQTPSPCRRPPFFAGLPRRFSDPQFVRSILSRRDYLCPRRAIPQPPFPGTFSPTIDFAI